ncbi:FMN phosphatase YigB (HAD superfamily) [Oxalobacteraceae bacterium GrIS 1.11]
MSTPDDIIFLLDVDNTLLDNDRLLDQWLRHLAHELGAARRERYLALLEQLRLESGYVDYLGALQRLRLEMMDQPRLLAMAAFLLDYPFGDLLYPGALEALAHLRKWGRTVILSDGDSVFQPRKVQGSGLWQAVEGRVLIYIHKEDMLDTVARLYPARHYVMVDDKLRILTSMKNSWDEHLTTIFPRQGHYAHDPDIIASHPPADMAIERIGDLIGHDFSPLCKTVRTASHPPLPLSPASAPLMERPQ